MNNHLWSVDCWLKQADCGRVLQLLDSILQEEENVQEGRNVHFDLTRGRTKSSPGTRRSGRSCLGSPPAASQCPPCIRACTSCNANGSLRKKMETSCKRYSASVRWLGLRSKGGGSYFFITRLICERTAALIPTPIFWAREKVKRPFSGREKKVIQENGLNSSPAGCRSGTDVCPAVAGDPQRPRRVLGHPEIGVRLLQWTKMPFYIKKRVQGTK